MRAVVVLVVWLLAHRAEAYPQWQLARDATCTSCHLAPDGGGLLNENGMATAHTVALLEHEPAFMYGTPELPTWLALGGDVRMAGGIVHARDTILPFYPMQGELSGTANHSGFSLHAVVGFRRLQDGGSLLHAVWSREHYVMWQQRPGEGTGLYVRAGRLMPTFGLRLAEHVVYTQRYGGRPLYHEAYALAVSFVDPSYEVHATAFAHDRLASAAEHGDGGALYAELRLGEHAALGVEAKQARSDDQVRTFAGITTKLFIPAVDVLLLGEAQVIRQHIDIGDVYLDQIVGFLMATRPLPNGLQLDVGVGTFQNPRVNGLYRDALDVNLHWFMSSHVEWLLTTRLEHLGGNGPNAGYALAQLHYRL